MSLPMPPYDTLLHAAQSPVATPAAPGVAHLLAALNAVPAGLLTFDSRLRPLFVGDRVAALLAIPASGVTQAASVPALLQASPMLDRPTTDRLRQVLQAAVDATGDSRSTFSSVAGPAPRLFTLAVTRLPDCTWLAAIEENTAHPIAEADRLQQTQRDALTGLPNRQQFHDRLTASLQHASAEGAYPAVLLLDLDRFKVVNDALGHPIGDALLRLVSKRLRSALRANDSVARLGGDEFAVLASPPLEAETVAHLGRRLVDLLSRPYLVEGHQVNIGASIGLVLAGADDRDAAQVLRNADLALHHAKSTGRGGCSFYDPEMDTRALRRRMLEIDLRKALPLGELELFYQPQIDLDHDEVVGFEALLRWRHPVRGLVPPTEFIPLAEEIGLIMPIGEWVLREACTDATFWPDTISVAVNVSPCQFADTTRLIDAVATALAASGLPGARLEIEITESALLRNDNTVLRALHAIHAMGVRVAMDDFGTGYSSLSQLHSFPFDKIKIDRSFVSDRGDPANQNAVIRAITALGESLGISTIAEGVETADQLARIREQGCGSVQGYLFSRPVPAGDVQSWIASFSQEKTKHS